LVELQVAITEQVNSIRRVFDTLVSTRNLKICSTRNAEIENQIKKGHQHEVKHQKSLEQAECRKDEKREQSKKKHKKKTPSITVPPNFPGSVTISPGETPYPEDNFQPHCNPPYWTPNIGGYQPSPSPSPSPSQGPSYNPPSSDQSGGPSPTDVAGSVFPQDSQRLDLAPGQQQLPTIPQTIPGRGPTQSTPPQQVITSPPTGGRTFKPGKQECRVVNLKSHGHRDTARWNFDVISQVGNNDYMIDVDVTLGNSWNKEKDSEYPKDTPRLEITSGGPGSHDKTSCCGFSLCVDCADGRLHVETEDWSQGGSTGTVYLKKGESISGNKPIFGQTVHLRWIYQSDTQGNVYYSGYAQMKGGMAVPFPVTKNPSSPGLHGAKLIPGKFAPGIYIANDPSRVRVDSAGCANFNGGPTVTILGKNTYKGNYYQGWTRGSDYYYSGPLGYIESYEASLI